MNANILLSSTAIDLNLFCIKCTEFYLIVQKTSVLQYYQCLLRRALGYQEITVTATAEIMIHTPAKHRK